MITDPPVQGNDALHRLQDYNYQRKISRFHSQISILSIVARQCPKIKQNPFFLIRDTHHHLSKFLIRMVARIGGVWLDHPLKLSYVNEPSRSVEDISP